MSEPAQTTKSNEWYTPRRYIEAAREVMGSIDLDPASCEQANEVVQATRFYSKEQNGLMQPWHGNVWLHPPFGRLHPELTGRAQSWQQAFVEKLWREHQSGHVQQACLLCLSMVKKWTLPYWSYPSCIIYDRTHYTRPDDTEMSFSYGSIIFYLGANVQKFIEVFSRFGRIARAIDTPPATPTNLELWSA